MTFGFDSSKKGHLNNNEVINLISKFRGSNAKVNKMTVKTEESEDLLDLVGKKLTYTEIINIPTDNIDNCFELRREFLIRAYKNNESYIKEYYNIKQYGT